jgi:hypothetical protein
LTPQETMPLKTFPLPGTSAPAWPVIDPSASIVGAFAALHAEGSKLPDWLLMSLYVPKRLSRRPRLRVSLSLTRQLSWKYG